jgi:hypothetical protein
VVRVRAVFPPVFEERVLDDDEDSEEEEDEVFDKEDGVMVAGKGVPARVSGRCEGCEDAHGEGSSFMFDDGERGGFVVRLLQVLAG